MHTPQTNIIAEYKGINIALTPDYKFVVVGSELFNGGKYHSLKSIEKAIDDRLLIAARLQVQTVHLLVLDNNGDECEITGLDLKEEDAGGYKSKLLGLPRGCYEFFPRADWVTDTIVRVRVLEAELNVLQSKLDAVMVDAGLWRYRSGVKDSSEELFNRMLEDFERKRKLAEAGPDAIPVNEGEDE